MLLGSVPWRLWLLKLMAVTLQYAAPAVLGHAQDKPSHTLCCAHGMGLEKFHAWELFSQVQRAPVAARNRSDRALSSMGEISPDRMHCTTIISTDSRTANKKMTESISLVVQSRNLEIWVCMPKTMNSFVLAAVLRRGLCAPKQRLFSFIPDVTKNLLVKAVVFEVDVLLNTDSQVQSIPAVSAPTSTTMPPKSSTDVDFRDAKAKYSEKMRMKLIKHDMTNPTANPIKASLVGSNTRYLLVDGMGNMLDNLYQRSMRLAVIGGKDTKTETLSHLSAQLADTKLAYVRPPFEPESNSAEWIKASLISMEETLKLNKDILLVSGSDITLAIGRARGYHTCRYRPPGGLYGQVSTDFVAQDALEIRDAIHELTGVAIRLVLEEAKR